MDLPRIELTVEGEFRSDTRLWLPFSSFFDFSRKTKNFKPFFAKNEKKRKIFPPIYLWNRACDFNLQYAKLSISSSPIEIWPQNYKNIFITSYKWPRKPPISSWNVEKSSKIAKIWQKMKKNQFFVFRAPFFAEKRRIEKKRKTKILRFGGTHR